MDASEAKCFGTDIKPCSLNVDRGTNQHFLHSTNSLYALCLQIILSDLRILDRKNHPHLKIPNPSSDRFFRNC